MARPLAGDAGVGPSDAGVAAPPQDGGVAALPAMAPDVKLLVDWMQSFYEKTQDFRASFRQDYFYKTFKRTQTSSGKVIYRKPALMRWNYETPSPKTFVLAGDRVLAHDPAADAADAFGDCHQHPVRVRHLPLRTGGSWPTSSASRGWPARSARACS